MSTEPKTGTPNGTESARSRRLVRGIVTSFASRGVAALAPLAMIPVLLPALGAATYGAWMTIVSLTAMLIWADLGLGNGLLTRLSRHLAMGDLPSGRRDILATYVIVTVVAGVLGVLALVSPFVLSWQQVLNTTASSDDGVTAIAIVCILCFCINMPLSLIQRIQYAAQQVGISNLFTAAGPLISLGLTLSAVASERSSPLIVASATVGPLLANVAATVWYFGHHRGMIPRLADRKGAQPFALLALGSLFVLISSFAAFANNSDSVIIAHTLGASRVAEFSVAARVMAAMGLLISLVNLPLWPANADALSRGDTAWVHRTTRRMSVLSGAFVLLSSLVIISLSEPLIRGLGQGLVQRDTLLLVCLGLWWSVVAITSPLMMVQNAAGVLLPQLLGWTLFLGASIPLKVLAIPYMGLYAGPLVGAILYCLLVLPSAIWGYRRTMTLARKK